MGLLEDLLARASPREFPPIPLDPADAANAMFGAPAPLAQRLRRGRPDTPLPEGSLLPFGSLGAGMLPPTMPAPTSAPDAETAAAPSINGPIPLPRERPKEADGAPAGDIATDPAALPPNSTPTTDIPPQPAPQSAPVAAPDQPSIFGRLMSGLKDNSATLLALGAGFAGAPNIGQGISRAAAGAIPASQADLKNRLLMQNQRETLNALLAAKVPPSMAMAALTNPEIMKAISARYLETKPYVPHKIGTDAMGNDIMGSFNPNNNKFYDAAGREIGGGGSSAGGVNIPDAGAGMFAKGVTEINQDLPAEEYKAQFSPQVQAQMDAYIRGDTMPTGNPRLKGSATKIKDWATLYGSKAGLPVSDATFSERRKYRTELGSNTPNSAGGQAKAFNQAVEHANALATQIEKLGNYDPVGIPLVAKGINATREGLSTKQTDIANQARTIGQTLAGEVGKLFSGSAGGGVHERELTRNRFNTVSSPRELAGALEGTLETMQGGLTALEQRRDQVLGPNNDVNFVNKETQQKIARIRDVIQRLRGEAPAAPAALPAGKTSSGVTWSIVQ